VSEVAEATTDRQPARAADGPSALELILEKLRAMTTIGSGDALWARRANDIAIQYEFAEPDGLRTYHSRVQGTSWTFGEGALADEECDVILRTTPQVLDDVLTGVAGGREAMLNGQLSMRKAPSHPKLLQMRAIFNRYTKSQARGDLIDLNADQG
jgi:hypothetical protein